MAERHDEAAEMVRGVAAEAGLIRLCQMLYYKGVLDAADVEILRHHHLADFDVPLEGFRLDQAVAEAIEERRARAERKWNEIPLQKPRTSGDKTP